jgi:hypothetical protein
MSEEPERSVEDAMRVFDANQSQADRQLDFPPTRMAAPPNLPQGEPPKWLNFLNIFLGPQLGDWISRHRQLTALVTVILALQLLFLVEVLPTIRGTQDVELNRYLIQKAKAEACSARSKAMLDTVPMNQLGEASAKLARECGQDQLDPPKQPTADNGPGFLSRAYGTIARHVRYTVTGIDPEDQAKVASYEKLLKAAQALRPTLTKPDLIARVDEVIQSTLLNLSFYTLLTHDYAKALTAAERGHSLFAGDLAIETNRAHALMFLGRTEEAKAIYLGHRGETGHNLQIGQTWEQVIAEDFARLRDKGLTHPLMAEIERQF